MRRRCLRLELILAVALASGAASAATLKNDGFETADFTSWEIGGEGWRVSGHKTDSNRGRFGAVNDVLIGGGDEYRVLSQRAKAQPGKEYDASVWLRTVCLEGTESFLEVQFLDKNGSVLRQHQSKRVNRDQEFRLVTIEKMVAPENTASVSIRGVVHVAIVPIANTDFHVFDDFDFRRSKE